MTAVNTIHLYSGWFLSCENITHILDFLQLNEKTLYMFSFLSWGSDGSISNLMIGF